MQLFKRIGYNNLDDTGSLIPVKQTCHPRFHSSIIALLGVFTATVLIICLVPAEQEEQFLRQSAGNETVDIRNDSINNTNTVNTTVLRLNDGRLKGKILKSRGGRDYFAFYNVPYAKPPVGNLRFEPPQEYTEGWSGVRDGTEPGDRCIQSKSGSSEVKGSEDCLYLSIFTPKLPPRRTFSSRRESGTELPVMVYIFGGGFIGGRASTYGGDYFMDTDVVLVLPEYRLGTLGNLNTEDEVVPGNMGFKDQVMVLRWIQKNIKKFGGDAKKVTIFGNSSGGMSVHAHIFSEMSRGLFHRAITQSGSALGLNVVVQNPRERAEEIGTSIGCPIVNQTQELINCLKQANASEMLSAQSSELTGLTVEPIPENGDMSTVFLSDTPLNLLQDGKIVSDVPWILGINSAELAAAAVVLSNSTATQFLNDNWDQIGPLILEMDVESANPDDVIRVAQEVRQFYFGDRSISNETRKEFVDMLGDRSWVHPTYVTASLYAQRSQSPVYLYWLTYEPVESVGSFLGEFFEPPFGVSHADEVQFLFPYSKFPFIPLGSKDANFSVGMVDIWSRFGNGKTPLMVGGAGVEWIPFDVSSGPKTEWLQLDEEPVMVEAFGDRMEFWNRFPLTDLYLENVTYA